MPMSDVCMYFIAENPPLREPHVKQLVYPTSTDLDKTTEKENENKNESLMKDA